MNVRFLCDGEEEVGGHSAIEFLEVDDATVDACVIFDSGMLGRGLPVFNIATRGTAYFNVTVRTGARDLHSGVFGGAALNAVHALVQALTGVLPSGGCLPAPLRAGVLPPSEDEWNPSRAVRRSTGGVMSLSDGLDHR